MDEEYKKEFLNKFTALPDSIHKIKELDIYDRVLYCYMAKIYSIKGEFYNSITFLSNKLNISSSRIKKSLKKLCELNFIQKVEKSYNKNNYIVFYGFKKRHQYSKVFKQNDVNEMNLDLFGMGSSKTHDEVYCTSSSVLLNPIKIGSSKPHHGVYYTSSWGLLNLITLIYIIFINKYRFNNNNNKRYLFIFVFIFVMGKGNEEEEVQSYSTDLANSYLHENYCNVNIQTASSIDVQDEVLTNSFQKETNHHRNGKERKGIVNAIQEQHLNQFWSLYPFKINYVEVEDYFERNNPTGSLFSEIIDGTKRYKNYIEMQERHNLIKRLDKKQETTIYTMKPITWLTKKKWKEDYKFTREEEIFIMRENVVKNNDLDCYYEYHRYLKKQSDECLIELYESNQIPDEDFFTEYNCTERELKRENQ